MENLQISNVTGEWYKRGYLPHFDGNQVPQMLTFRLIDSYPQQCLVNWKKELESLPIDEAEVERRLRIEEYLDKGAGSACRQESIPVIPSVQRPPCEGAELAGSVRCLCAPET